MSLNTNPIQSFVLKAREVFPETACASCQNAVWHETDAGDLRIWCKLMFVLIDVPLALCDGNPPQPPEPDETGEPGEASAESATSLADLDLEDRPSLDDIPDPSSGPEDLDTEADWSDLNESGIS